MTALQMCACESGEDQLEHPSLLRACPVSAMSQCTALSEYVISYRGQYYQP
jgi:hypothetical protein